jgi:GNAT superfamily N-acetyltransferase
VRPGEQAEAVGVLARGMRDNPMHVAALGADPDSRVARLESMFGVLFDVVAAQTPICAKREGVIVGVTGMALSPGCMPRTREQLRMMPRVLGLGPRTTARVIRWTGAWAKRDPDEPHSHLGPLAVDAHLRGQGIGSAIMEEYCRRVDAAGTLGYLETDKPENVGFYERFGFATVAEARVLGVPNWFMRRGRRGAAA